jgi:hypothetical protein
MSEYKPRLGTQIAVLASLFAVVLPAICLAAVGYMWLLKHGLNLDVDAHPEGVLANLLMFLAVIPIIPTMLAAILLTGIPWMFVMAHFLSWDDIQYFTSKKGPRLPWLSDWLDRIWLHMIEPRRPESPTRGSSQ